MVLVPKSSLAKRGSVVAKELSLGVTGSAPVVPSGFSVMISEEESSIPGMSSDESIGDVSLVSGICGVVPFLSSVVLVVSVVPPVHPVSMKQKTSKHSIVISIFFMLLFRSAAITAFYIEAKLKSSRRMTLCLLEFSLSESTF